MGQLKVAYASSISSIASSTPAVAGVARAAKPRNEIDWTDNGFIIRLSDGDCDEPRALVWRTREAVFGCETACLS
jgi:hypothetical protein